MTVDLKTSSLTVDAAPNPVQTNGSRSGLVQQAPTQNWGASSITPALPAPTLQLPDPIAFAMRELTPSKQVLNLPEGTYEGFALNGKPHGSGVLTYSSSNEKHKKYEGEFQNGLRQGNGTLTWRSGNRYIGEFEKNKLTGSGRYEWNGRVYEGNVENGEYQGQGTLKLPDGTKFVGNFNKGSVHGYAEQYMPDGGSYKGNWKNGEWDGQGTWTYPSPHISGGHYRFTGTFKDGKRWEGKDQNDHKWTNGQVSYCCVIL